jgi:Flp pilus assembly CpaF family ATPase
VHGPEAAQLVRALTTMFTLHANGRETSLARLQSLVLEAEPNSRFVAVEASIGAVVQIAQERAAADRGLLNTNAL